MQLNGRKQELQLAMASVYEHSDYQCVHVPGAQ